MIDLDKMARRLHEELLGVCCLDYVNHDIKVIKPYLQSAMDEGARMMREDAVREAEGAECRWGSRIDEAIMDLPLPSEKDTQNG